jgi:isopropylmalate/homocitrate/citramalate synthase
MSWNDGDDVPSTANVLTDLFASPVHHPVEFYDMTLREGEQPPGIAFTPDEKVEIASALDEFGVHWANVGFPPCSNQEQEAIRRIACMPRKMRIAGLSRLSPEDIDLTVGTGVDMVGLFYPGSDVHLRYKLRKSEAEALSAIEAAVRRCKDSGVIAKFAIEDASRTPLPRLLRMFQVAVEAGADYLAVCDTVGVLTPTTTRRLFEVLVKLFPRPMSVHFHNDLGLSLANALAAYEAGAQMMEVTVNGVGERAGNTCLEELAVVLRVKYGLDLGFKLDRLYELSMLVHRASGTRVSEHKPISGKWCFTHESGIHVAGIIANPETYQPFPPRLVGRRHELAFGKHSGVHSVGYVAQERGIRIEEATARAVLEKVKHHAESKQGSVTLAQVLEWIKQGA